MKPAILIWIGLLIFSNATLGVEDAESKQRKEVEEIAQQVVPYDKKETLETFSKTVHGGVQHVVVKSPDNAQQIQLIQDYLSKMANDFRKGDFSIPERIHGADMPGLAQFKKAEPDDILYEYKALPDGAQIHYTTEWPLNVQAIHEFFDAQIKSHGDVVVPKHKQHHQTFSE
ncbi:MAG: aspartate carbamoyltransferase [Gammaproteobacteria bacterium]